MPECTVGCCPEEPELSGPFAFKKYLGDSIENGSTGRNKVENYGNDCCRKQENGKIPVNGSYDRDEKGVCDVKDSCCQSNGDAKPCGQANLHDTEQPLNDTGKSEHHHHHSNDHDPILDPHHGHDHHDHEYHHSNGHHGNTPHHGHHDYHPDHDYRDHDDHHDSEQHHDHEQHHDRDCSHHHHDHDHNHDHIDAVPSSNRLDDMKTLVDAVVDMDDDDKLRLQTTKLRVQNVCCPKESRIVADEMKKLQGIKSVRMNVIGRVVHISHYSDVVSPIELMAALNKRHLGASIVDTGEEEDVEHGFPKSLMILLAFLAIQAVLFSVSLAGRFSGGDWYMWVAIVEICIGMIPVSRLAWHSAKHLQIDLNILITITVIGTLAIAEWIEGAAVVFVFTMADFLQRLCFYKVQKTISSLMLAKPSKAVIASTGEYVPVEDVPVGSIIAVRQGELIPLDGIVVKGSGSVDESSVSGEAAPVEKRLKSQIFSGTVIQHGYLEIETTSTSKSSTISKISEMVEEAQMNVSPMEIMVNEFAKYYTPLVVIIAALVFLIPLFLGLAGVHVFEGKIKMWGEMALIVLVTACPCSLLMATPTVVICGINGAAHNGALVKGGNFLEALAHLTFIAFDKTGTLTEGKFQVVDLVSVDKGEETEILRWVAALESKSSHPLAAAVVTKFTGECIADFIADSEDLDLPEVGSFRTVEGQGISGDVEGHHIQIGNRSMLEKLNVTLPPEFEASYIAFSCESKTVVFVCVDEELALMISLTDIIRPESYTALKWLQDLGIRVIMLTGDARQTARAVQKELQIDSCISEMKPDDKLKWISETKEEQIEKKIGCFSRKRNQVVGMVGDGVNDGPALATADVGIAMGAGGSALAVEAGGVALMTNSLLAVPELICLSRFCRRIIVENITLAVSLKVAFLAVALTGYVHIWMAIVADLVGLVAVIINGLRPLRWESAKTKKIKSSQPKASLFGKKGPDLQYESLMTDPY